MECSARQDNTPNKFHSQTFRRQMGSLTRPLEILCERVNKDGRSERNNDDRLWTIFNRKWLFLQCPLNFLAHHSSCFVFWVLDSPPCFRHPSLIGYTPHSKGCELVCPQGEPHTLGYWAITFQHWISPIWDLSRSDVLLSWLDCSKHTTHSRNISSDYL